MSQFPSNHLPPSGSPPSPAPHAQAAPSPVPYASPIAYASALRPQLEHDRRGALIAFGVVTIIIGALAACVAVLTPLSLLVTAFAPAAPPPNAVEQVLFTAAVYAAAATLFIWTGIGSVRCRRWVRPIIISLGWPMIILGVLGLAGWLIFARDFPAMLAAAQPKVPAPGPAAPPPPGPNPTTLAALITAIMAVFYVIVPAVFVWFYSTRAVRQTLEAYDARISWTQRCPLPIFAGAVNLVLGGVITLSLVTVGAVPFFGQYVEGAPAALLVVAAALTLFAAAVLFYLGKFLGWLLAVAVVTCGFLSAIVTFAHTGMLEFYLRGQTDPVVLRMLERSTTMTGFIPIVFVAIAMLICVAYLLWVRTYFTRRPREAQSPTAYPSPS
jgi:hypothetical protein